jgi:oligoribonuclease NrnB/cAMP/cGMP phosphodiesterase (DHH superfamily)
MTAAVAVARYHCGATVQPHFSSNADINDTLLRLRCEPLDIEHEVWITDISWTDPRVDRHLQTLVDRGVKVYWIDHHRTAVERHRAGAVTVRFTDHVLSEEYAASRLTYEYLRDRQRPGEAVHESLAALERLVAMADDHDRWLHCLPESRTLARIVTTLGAEAYPILLHIDAGVTYTPAMHAAAQKAEVEMRHSVAIAERSRIVRSVSAGLRLVTAVCDGHTSEIAEAWGRSSPNTIFAFFDARTLSVSLRRSPDCTVDLSHLGRALGGGGHAAAAGCELADLRQRIAEVLAGVVQDALSSGT